jgi:hypothetical protein
MDLDQQGLERWLEKWQPAECPVCHTDNWSAAERVFQISNYEYAGNLVPVFLLGCGTCGYLLPIHAHIAGVMPDQDSDSPSSSEAT